VQQIKSCRRQLHRPNKLTPSSAGRARPQNKTYASACPLLSFMMKQATRSCRYVFAGPRRTASKIGKTSGVTRSKYELRNGVR
jgi:hypothetical protein